MLKKIFFVLPLILLLTATNLVYSAIPASERAALIELYKATNGDNWTNNSGWKDLPLEADGFGPIGSENSWYGIHVVNDHVQDVSLEDNNLSGSLPAELGDLSNLLSLSLGRNQITGSIPPELGSLQHLYSLSLNLNQLSGSIPPELGNLDSLTYLSLIYNQLTGSIPPELGNLEILVVLKLQGNQLSGSIPAELENLDKLEQLYLHQNQLSGIPPELGNLDSLTMLYLHDNNFSGSIPAELGNLSTLTQLTLNDNDFSGSIPPELENLSQLVSLDLSGNQLSSIPPELGRLWNLTSLKLSNNQLSGSIPAELGNLSGLTILLLNGNQLSGEIPINIGSLTNLGNWFGGQLDLGYNAIYTTNEVLRAFLNGKDENWEATQTIAPVDVSAASASSSSITVSWTPIAYTGDTGGYMVYYSIVSGGPWTYAGTTSDKSIDSYTVTGLSTNTTYYFVVKTRTDAHANNANIVVSEYSAQASAATPSVPPAQDQPPFGTMELPAEGGAPVSGSIAVSGWALDDVEVVSVKIYNVDGDTQTYIGDAVLVEGARPDVEQAYPQYPNNRKAGWGYMLLTNFLSNGGNGTYNLRAIARDYLGHETILGTKTIVCDNANAVIPFGAIDTPPQGGIASGTTYRNNGWVLAAGSNAIPIDGSTINVYVNGVNLGNPFYNVYRQDIYNLFPGYTNRDGAGAYFDLDTTVYDNGVHTIYWTAADDGGNTAGIGSRYFAVQNSGNSARPMGHGAGGMEQGVWSKIPVFDPGPMKVKKGYHPQVEPQSIFPDNNGMITIEIKNLERIVIQLGMNGAKYSGYLLVGNQSRPLPIGSTLDRVRGLFYWHASPGFWREYLLMFTAEFPNGEIYLKYVTIKIVP